MESVLAATVVEIERNQGRIANPGPKVKFYPMIFVLIFEEKTFADLILNIMSHAGRRRDTAGGDGEQLPHGALSNHDPHKGLRNNQISIKILSKFRNTVGSKILIFSGDEERSRKSRIFCHERNLQTGAGKIHVYNLFC